MITNDREISLLRGYLSGAKTLVIACFYEGLLTMTTLKDSYLNEDLRKNNVISSIEGVG